METTINNKKGSRIAGWIISILVILFMLFDVFGKLTKPEAVVKGTMQLGYPESLITPIGIILLMCTILYSIPRTSLLGAMLLTGYFGGAVASNLRVENPLFSNTLFPVYFAILAWTGVYLRNASLRKLITHKSS
jgi:ABC-type transport system involved in cytochrome c biogenesis permease component